LPSLYPVAFFVKEIFSSFYLPTASIHPNISFRHPFFLICDFGHHSRISPIISAKTPLRPPQVFLFQRKAVIEKVPFTSSPPSRFQIAPGAPYLFPLSVVPKYQIFFQSPFLSLLRTIDFPRSSTPFVGYTWHSPNQLFLSNPDKERLICIFSPFFSSSMTN